MRFGANYDTRYTETFETTRTGRDKAIQATLSYKIGDVVGNILGRVDVIGLIIVGFLNALVRGVAWLAQGRGVVWMIVGMMFFGAVLSLATAGTSSMIIVAGIVGAVVFRALNRNKWAIAVARAKQVT
jgi:hypothetical protein